MLPALGCEGARIVARDTGLPLLLQGVNVSGMEYSDTPLAGVTPDELTTIVRGWGANVVRIPFTQSLVLQGRNGDDYVAELQELVTWLAELGAYSILDLQWLDREKVWGPGDNRVPPAPDERSADCWARLAKAFAGHPAVIFDLLNEPHDISAAEWNEWALRLAGAIRAVDPARVLMVSGVNWAFDLRGVELQLPNVIYSTHIYPWMNQDWWTYFGHRAGEAPLFAGEFGGGPEDLVWGRKLLAYMRELGMGWTAWSWRDKPHLQNQGIPTIFGELVLEALHRNPPVRSGSGPLTSGAGGISL
jgi:hypothetical protein